MENPGIGARPFTMGPDSLGEGVAQSMDVPLGPPGENSGESSNLPAPAPALLGPTKPPQMESKVMRRMKKSLRPVRVDLGPEVPNDVSPIEPCAPPRAGGSPNSSEGYSGGSVAGSLKVIASLTKMAKKRGKAARGKSSVVSSLPVMDVEIPDSIANENDLPVAVTTGEGELFSKDTRKVDTALADHMKRRRRRGRRGSLMSGSRRQDENINSDMQSGGPPKAQSRNIFSIYTPDPKKKLEGYESSSPMKNPYADTRQMPSELALPDTPPPGPVVVIYSNNLERQSLRMHSLDIHISMEFCNATITINGVWENRFKHQTDCYFELQLAPKATMDSIEVAMLPTKRMMSSSLIPNDTAKEMCAKLKSQSNEFNRMVDLFRVPIVAVFPGEHLMITAKYRIPLNVTKNFHFVNIPFTFPEDANVSTKKLLENVNIVVDITTCVPVYKAGCSTHPLNLTRKSTDMRWISFELDKSQPINNTDIQVSFGTKFHNILQALVHHRNEEKTTFVAQVFPCDISTISSTYGRHIVLCVDVGISMAGQIFESVKKALLEMIDTIRPQDTFGIILFDNEVLSLQDEMVPGTPKLKKQAKEFIRSMGCSPGKPDIMMALNRTYKLHSENPVFSKTGGIRMTYLITDSATKNEKFVCRMTIDKTAEKRSVRIHTVGIGPYCNHTFLRMLSIIGRGSHETILDSEKVYSQIVRLFYRTEVPILTEVSTNIALVCKEAKVKIFPHPIPDLYTDGPITIVGEIDGPMKTQLYVTGLLASGQVYKAPFQLISSTDSTVSRIYWEQRIQVEVCKAWLLADPKILDDVADTSRKLSIPTPSTQMVVYESDMSRLRKKMSKVHEMTEMEKLSIVAFGNISFLGVYLGFLGSVKESQQHVLVENGMDDLKRKGVSPHIFSAPNDDVGVYIAPSSEIFQNKSYLANFEGRHIRNVAQSPVSIFFKSSDPLSEENSGLALPLTAQPSVKAMSEDLGEDRSDSEGSLEENEEKKVETQSTWQQLLDWTKWITCFKKLGETTGQTLGGLTPIRPKSIRVVDNKTLGRKGTNEASARTMLRRSLERRHSRGSRSSLHSTRSARSSRSVKSTKSTRRKKVAREKLKPEKLVVAPVTNESKRRGSVDVDAGDAGVAAFRRKSVDHSNILLPAPTRFTDVQDVSSVSNINSIGMPLPSLGIREMSVGSYSHNSPGAHE